MMLRRNNLEGKEKSRRNEAEKESDGKKGKFRSFCSKFWESTKRTSQILAIATGMAVIAYGCGSRPHVEGDADADNVEIIDEDTSTDSDAPDIGDVIDEEISCIGDSEVLEGEVNPLISNTFDGEAVLDNSDSEVSGDIEITIGGDVSGDMLVLGECPEDSGSIAAIGANGESMNVTSQYRIDLGGTTFSAEMPSVDETVCPPPEVDEVPVSMFIDETNLVVKEAVTGTIDTRGEFGFVTPLVPVILVNDSESVSPVAFDGSGYEVKTVMVSLVEPLLEMAAVVHSESGDTVLEREVNGSVETVNSKTLRTYQIDSTDSILPVVNWDTPMSATLCLRSADGSPKELDLEINGDVIAAVTDACGKIFAGFDVDSLAVNIRSFSQPTIRGNYSIPSSAGTGLYSMEEGNANMTVTFRREADVYDEGFQVIMEVEIEGRLVSKEDNPETGAPDTFEFALPVISIRDPDSSVYLTECGYEPSL